MKQPLTPERYQADAGEREREQRLYGDYEAIDLIASDRLGHGHGAQGPELNRMRSINPARYFLLCCETEVRRLIGSVLKEPPDTLRRDLLHLVEDQQRQRELWDRIKKTRGELFGVIHERSADAALAEALDDRAPRGGYFPDAKMLERELLRAVRNTYERRRDMIYQVLKEIIAAKKANEPDAKKIEAADGVLHFLSTMQMFYRARAIARKAHHKVLQTRGTGEAYLRHTDDTALLLLLACRPFLKNSNARPNSLIVVPAGECHDTDEDTPLKLDDLEHELFVAFCDYEHHLGDTHVIRDQANGFASRVRMVVELDTETPDLKKLPKPARELAMIERIKSSEPEDIHQGALMVKLSDRIDNTITLEGMGGLPKRRTKLRSTVRWCRFALEEEKRGVDTAGLAELLIFETSIAYEMLRIDSGGRLMEEEDLRNINELNAMNNEMTKIMLRRKQKFLRRGTYVEDRRKNRNFAPFTF